MKNKYFQMFLWCITFVLLGMIFLLPQIVPIHWNINGEIDGYASRYVCIVFAILPAFIYYAMTLTRKIDPHQEKINIRINTYELMKKITVILLIAIDIFYYYMILFKNASVQTGICIIIGLFIVTIGNYMPKVPQNFFFGIRTPWTLKNEIVWQKTHRVGGYAFIILGLMTIVAGFIEQAGFYILMIVAIPAVIFPCIYSYLEYKKIIEN